ncbi:putative integral membrane protein [Theileria parva strain Muguga]|uniref:putative integral membrane protein n=1 Tax=Theileria parva strain Muguga TaxID=333668 RepID=UPI001C618AA0|nr:putative integral membrane protein [Theileria parva strain Muguga]KAF5153170.1 putative integral membrane protein [Theileria parva strain Muguga]
MIKNLNFSLQSLDGLLLSFGFFFISLTVMALSWFLYGETITAFYKHHVSSEFGEDHTKKKLT